eukprot:gnl/TRDRNA2_/TRDRNA2_41299_c0_seq1.p1 gnl/TRDRNA2_/TRDRNA2_41299_c0~~gnl/TRDRNA2_/TRDRNA2_41299_c0_seq1.p1  ORF type:complete len:151 (+),score=0.32 gnl/TRDRNA2_/TRDRNA2_41299_c0_seq1:25-477(+)
MSSFDTTAALIPECVLRILPERIQLTMTASWECTSCFSFRHGLEADGHKSHQFPRSLDSSLLTAFRYDGGGQWLPVSTFWRFETLSVRPIGLVMLLLIPRSGILKNGAPFLCHRKLFERKGAYNFRTEVMLAGSFKRNGCFPTLKFRHTL